MIQDEQKVDKEILMCEICYDTVEVQREKLDGNSRTVEN